MSLTGAFLAGYARSGETERPWRAGGRTVAREAEITALRRELGERLAGFRRAADLTQGQLARVVFCDRTSVVHIEKGRRSADGGFGSGPMVRSEAAVPAGWLSNSRPLASSMNSVSVRGPFASVVKTSYPASG